MTKRPFLTFTTVSWLEKHRHKLAHNKLVQQTALDPIKVQNLAEMFNHLDNDGNGTLELDEIQLALEALSYNSLKAQEILARFELMDADGSGELDFEEFVGVMTSGDVYKLSHNLKDEQEQELQNQAFYEFATT